MKKLVPTRSKSRGSKPGITGEQMTSEKVNNFAKFDTWTFDRKDFTPTEERQLLGAALETGIKAAFNLHCYQFAGKTYKQKKGGPTGKKLTSGASRIQMKALIKELRKILSKSMIDLILIL